MAKGRRLIVVYLIAGARLDRSHRCGTVVALRSASRESLCGSRLGANWKQRLILADLADQVAGDVERILKFIWFGPTGSSMAASAEDSRGVKSTVTGGPAQQRGLVGFHILAQLADQELRGIRGGCDP